MKIDLGNYVIELDTISGYNLYKKGVVLTGDNTGNETITNIGYNMKLDSCAKKIIHNNMVAINDVVSARQFIDLYKEEAERIEKLFKDVS